MRLLHPLEQRLRNTRPSLRSIRSLTSRSPALIVLFIALTVYATEAALMLLFSYLPRRSFRVEALMDATLLVIIISPALYFYLFKPMVAQVSDRQRSEQRFQTLAEATFEGIAICSQGKLLDVNDQLARMLEYEVHELTGRNIVDFIPAEDQDRVMSKIQMGTKDAIEHDLLRKGGTRIAVECHSQAVKQQGLPIILIAVRDISERKEHEKEWRLAATLYDASGEAMAITDVEHNIVSVNPAFTQITGYSADEVLGRNFLHFCADHHDEPFYREMVHSLARTNHWAGEVWDKKKNGEAFAVRLTISAIVNGGRTGKRYAAQFSDITEKKKLDEIISTQANFDSLTGLPNRRLFRDLLDQEIKKTHRTHHNVALMFVDLDRFKDVNDKLGHLVGDKLLVQAAKRIVACVRESDVVARLGGDEFTVILSEVTDVNHIENVAHAITQSLSQPYNLGEEGLAPSASIGITIYPTDATNPEDLIRFADQAMYLSKSEGRNCYHFFTEAMQETTRKRHQLAQDLYGAMQGDQFRIHFQPIVDLKTGGIFKAEALLRWQHPIRGMIGPAEFIPVAEDIGLIDEISDWVLKESLGQGRRWAHLLGNSFRVGVNISPVQFRAKHNTWMKQMQELKLGGKTVSLEITEGTLLNDRPEVVEALHAVHDAGMEVAIDDFGTGYSALSYLQKFKIDYLKIDQSFTRNLAPGSTDLALSEAIIVMAHKLGMKVIAEGIETPEQRDLMAAAGCDFGQGFLFSRPVPSDEFEKLLPRRSAPGHRPLLS